MKVDLIVRGVCALRPGISRGVGEHPRPLDRRSISRTLPRLLLRERRESGAVLRERGLDGAQLLPSCRSRLPVRRDVHRARILNDLETYLKDDTQSWDLGRDGIYSKVPTCTEMPTSAQSQLLSKYAAGASIKL